MNTLLQDLRFALRQLRRSPGFTLTVLLTMTLSIGATAALCGVLRATLLNPLPYPSPQHLVRVEDRNLKGFHTNGLVSVARIAELEAMQHDGHPVFASVGYFYLNPETLVLPGSEPTRASGAAVSANFFQTVAAPPLLGRTLAPADNVRNAPLTTVLSEHLWKSTFAGDPHVLGRTVKLGPDQATVVGVMPARFDLPSGIDVWYPGRITPAMFAGYRGDGSRFMNVIARLQPAETLQSGTQAANLLANRLAQTYPQTDAAWAFTLTDLRTSLFGDYRRALILLSAAVGLVLLVATVNIAGLQLARNAAREQEFAVRTALGISRPRLVRQLITESTLLIATGGIMGIATGALLLRALVHRLPEQLLRVDRPHIDATVLAITAALTLVVALCTGLLPAWGSTRASLSQTGNRTVARRTGLFGRAFSTAQIALALVLLTLSAAVLQNLYTLLRTPLGYDAAQLQTFTVDFPWSSDMPKRHQTYAVAEQRLAGLPGIESVGAIGALPLSDFSVRGTFDIDGQPASPNHDTVAAEARSFTPGYLHTLHIPLLAGRDFTGNDSQPKAPAVVLINNAFAKRYFPGRSAIGQRLVSYNGIAADTRVLSEIVGIIGDVHGTGGTLTAPLQPEIYTPEDGGWPHLQFAVRTTLPAATLEPQVRRLLAGIDSSASVSHFVPLTDSVDRSLLQPRLNALLLTLFAAFAMVLVIIGVYGLFAFNIAQRTREFALRLALGSTRTGIVTLLLGDAGKTLAVGIAIGIAGSIAAARILTASLGTGNSHLVLLDAPAILVLALAVLSAALLPARRAAHTDLNETLRAE